MRDGDRIDDRERNRLHYMLPEKPSAGSLFSFFNRFLARGSARRGCIMMPRIFHGAKEDADAEGAATTASMGAAEIARWKKRQFESLRWRYHVDLNTFRQRPKAMVDVSRLQLLGEDGEEKDEIRYAHAQHRPFGSRLADGSEGCSPEPWSIYDENRLNQPLAVNHYLGSLERFLSRDDVRRNAGMHASQNGNANYAKGDNNDTGGDGARWWIGGWLDSFVETHGSEKALAVLLR